MPVIYLIPGIHSNFFCAWLKSRWTVIGDK